MRFDKLLNISHAARDRFIDLFLGFIFHDGELFNAGCFCCYYVLDFGGTFTLLMKLYMSCNALRAKRLNAISSLTNICDRILLVRGTWNWYKSRSTRAVYRSNLTPTTSRCHFWFKHLKVLFKFYNEVHK